MSRRWNDSTRGSAPKEVPDEAELRFFERLQTLLKTPEVHLSKRLARICAADASYIGREVVSAAVLALDGTIAETYRYRGRFTFPYVSGLFYLHEGPFAVAAIEGLRAKPQLLCFDAHGEAHPRSAGLAKVAGMVLGVPSIGVAKSLLVGEAKKPEGERLETIEHRGNVLGFVTGSGRERRYWSPGYSVTLKDLEGIIVGHRKTCLMCLAEAHHSAAWWVGSHR